MIKKSVMQTTTVGELHEQISKKLLIIKTVVTQLKLKIIEYDALSTHYITSATEYIIHASEARDPIIITRLYDAYMAFIVRDSIFQQISNLASFVFKHARASEAHLIHEFNKIRHVVPPVKQDINVCDSCDGIEFVTQHDSSEYYCVNCGRICKITGEYFEQTENARNISYKPAKHCENWVKQIFGIEKKEIPELLIINITQCMARDNVINPSSKLIREYLKELKETRYNSNVVKIRRRITGLGPPLPSTEQYTNICRKFTIQDYYYTQIKKDALMSRIYYPSFISKAIEDEYETYPAIRNLILEGIHIQEHATTQYHDQIYERICAISGGELKFRRTSQPDSSLF